MCEKKGSQGDLRPGEVEMCCIEMSLGPKSGWGEQELTEEEELETEYQIERDVLRFCLRDEEERKQIEERVRQI